MKLAPTALALALLAGAGAAVAQPAPVAPQAAPPVSAMPADLTAEGVAAADPNLWLEEVRGERAMAWVAEQNARTVQRLEQDPRFETYRQQAFAILSATDRIATPHLQGEMVYNFWQDAEHPKGVWRRTSLDSYRSDAPVWETVIDVGALAAAEGRDWFWKGAECLAPDEARCLVSLSIGGGDAVEIREFDTTTGRWVEGGFHLPSGKHRYAWQDQDHLYVATDFGPTAEGAPTLTESGYPWTVRRLARGQSLADAPEVFRGTQGDGGYGVSPTDLRDLDGDLVGMLIERPLDTFRAETWLVSGEAAPVKLNLPGRLTTHGLFRGQWLVFTTEQDWTFDGQDYASGALLALPIARLGPERDAALTSREEALVFTPSPTQSINDVELTRFRVVVSMLDNVSGRILAIETRGEFGWRAFPLNVADNSVVTLVDAEGSGDRLFYSVQSFLAPTELHLVNDITVPDTDFPIKSLPAQFDAGAHVVEQAFATSTDGTRVPYYVVRPRELPMDGSAPTLIFGYGGFNAPYLPLYTPQMGKLWLEHGGVYVVANIRGGGEYGPGWHQSALRENRQRSFDDFAAVARDLQARNITSPRRTGIYGRSNGGVLTTVTLTQHPELINAAVIESPLADMLRYHLLSAGASWIGEYGDPRVAEDAAFIARYSGYQNVRADVRYPEVYVTTNTGDDRVHPGHARKFAERLRQMGQPYLFYEDTSGGHSFDADPVANARRWARHYVYLSQRLMD
ncbi:MAG TPA: prolyl oligopeptidase family serine peptidase [Caulobacteraceae bacterium]